ncbi:hypothetical protein ABIB40_001683 [Pedobacter sp. UYP30]|uniref:WG repeat-containing protein n=1 Tax=Pedobacter sp. UYP30 TaxID=1756400 RepID=UPI0033914A43
MSTNNLHKRIKAFLPVVLISSFITPLIANAQKENTNMKEVLIPVQNTQHKWGYINAKTGEVAIEPKYDQVSLFINGIAEVSNVKPDAKYYEDGLVGWIDTTGKEIFAPQFTHVSQIKRFSNQDVIPTLTEVNTADDKMGIISWPEGKWLLTPGKYHDFFFYDKDYFIIDKKTIVLEGKKYNAPSGCTITYADQENHLLYIQKEDDLHNGLCTWEGKILVPPEFLEVTYLPEIKRILVSGLKENITVLQILKALESQKRDGFEIWIYLLNTEGKTLAQFSSEYQADVLNDSIGTYQTQAIPHYFSLIDGKTIAAPEKTPQFDYTIFANGGKHGLKDKNGKELVSAKYSNLTAATSALVIAESLENYKYGIINKYGKQIIPFEFNSLEHMKNHRFRAEKGDKYGVIDDKGKTIINFKYQLGTYFNENGLANVVENGKEGVIDTTGKEVIPVIYKSLFNTKEIDSTAKTYYTAEKDGKWGLLDSVGKILVPFDYGYLSVNKEDFKQGWVFTEDAKRIYRGLYNIKTGVIVPPIYDATAPYSDFIIVAKRKDNDYYHQLLSTAGKPLTDSSYTKMDFTYSYLSCCKDNKYGVLDKSGKVLVPFKYRYLWEQSSDLLMAQQGEDYFYVNTEGEEFKMP